MDIASAKSKLIELQTTLSAYYHAEALISYDGDTSAPSATAENRAQSLGVLSELSYRLSTCAETVETLEFLDAHKEELDEREKRMVYLLLKDIRFKQKIPPEEYVEYEKLIVLAQDVWHKAKAENDFASFEPYLARIFDTVRRFAAYAKPETDPYDYWLNEFEPGTSRQTLDAFFARVRERLVPLIKRCAEKPQVDVSVLKGDFPEDAQEKLAYLLMKQLGLDLTHVGLATTEHPFTTSLGSHKDVRITTHYHTDDVSSSMYSVIHEGGHALYDTGSDDELAYTVLDGGVSMGIHESQSRFYENILGRSKAFIKFIFPKIAELFPAQTQGHTWTEFYRAVNRVEPSLIRTEADEVTYSLHVMIRYELEKAVMAGQLNVHDLPREWNRLYKEYLGVDVPDDTHGVLQDSHWSGGAIGYFPSYALGSAYGAQLYAKMRESVDTDAALARGDLSEINEWNRRHIWHFGSLKEPADLLKEALETEFDPEYYLKYLEEKVKDIYG